MSVAVTLAFYIIKLSKDVLSTSSMILDKLEAKIEAESTVEQLKFIISTNPFYKNMIKINNGNYESKKEDEMLNLTEIYIDGRERKVGDTVIRVKDSSGKINITSIDRNTLMRILNYLGASTREVNIASDSYEDWIDSDDFKHINGAEKYYYQIEKGYKYSPRNNINLQSIEELKLIRGFKDIYNKLKDFVILSYKGGGINVYIVDAKSLSALFGISIDKAKEIIKLREKEEKFGNNSPTMENLASDSEILSTFPNYMLEINVETTKNEAKEKVYCIIDFRPDENTPFRTIKYQQ